MKTLYKLLLGFIFLCSAFTFAQDNKHVDREPEYLRIENAFQNSNPTAIEDLLSGSVNLRIGDSLYQSISSIQVIQLLKKYFVNKSDVNFKFNSNGNGTLKYKTKDGKEREQNVDVFLSHYGKAFIYALNFSDYPTTTMFYKNHGKGKD